MNDERRCLIIDKQPTIRLGVRGLLASRYEVEEATDGRDALGLITSVGDFDVAIVELASANGEALTGLPAIRALRKARPALGIVAHAARPEHHAASEAIGAGATAYVAKSSPAAVLETAVDAAAEAEDFIDPAARRNGHSLTRAPAPDPAAVRGRPLDRERGAATRAQHRDGPHPHQGRARAPLRPRPRPRGRDRHPLLPDRVGTPAHPARPDAERTKMSGA